MGTTIPRLKPRQFFARPSFPLYVSRHTLDGAAPVQPHSHEFGELFVIHGGHGTHVVNGQSHLISEGDVFVIPREQPHAFSDSKRLQVVNVMFQAERLPLATKLLQRIPGFNALFVLEPRLRSAGRGRHNLHLRPPELRVCLHHIKALEDELRLAATGFEAQAVTHFQELVVWLARRYTAISATTPFPLLRMGDVISHIEQYPAETLTLSELAKIAHMSVNNLLRVFKQATGQSPLQYQIRLRVLRAAELLRTSPLNVTEASFEAGFRDSNYFSRQFKRIMRIAPSDYSRSFRKSADMWR